MINEQILKPLFRGISVVLLFASLLGCAELGQLRQIKDEQDKYIRELEEQSASYKDTYYKLVEQRTKEQEEFNARVFKLEREIERVKSEQREKEKELGQQNQDLRLSLELKAKEIAAKEALHRAAVKGLEERIAALNKKNDSLDKERVEALRTADQLSSEVARLRTQITALQAELRAQETAATARERQLAERDKRLKELEESLSKAGQERETLTSREKELEHQIQQLNQKINAASPDTTETKKIIEELARLRKELDSVRRGQQIADPQLDAALAKLEPQLAEMKKSGSVAVQKDRRGLVVIVQNDVLFQPESVILKREASQLLSRISSVFAEYKERSVSIEGHTDNQPIENLPFYDNLALASARADNVMRYFIEEGTIPASRLKSVSCGEYYPLAPNSTPEGRKQNRRVEIVLAHK